MIEKINGAIKTYKLPEVNSEYIKELAELYQQGMQKYSSTLDFRQKGTYNIGCAYDMLEVELHTDKGNITYKMQ